jgi:rifampicin phosphotransferase
MVPLASASDNALAAYGTAMTPTEGPKSFPISFDDPSDSALTWNWDEAHFPSALMPLACDYAEVIRNGVNARYSELGDFPQRWKCAIWNGYVYCAFARNVADQEWPRVRADWLAVCRAQAEETASWWRDSALPELRRLCTSIEEVAPNSLSAADLKGAWNTSWSAVARIWELHFVTILGPYVALNDLADFYETVIPDARSEEAFELVLGQRTVLTDVEIELENLATLLRASGPQAASFRVQLDTFLRRHGHLGQASDDLAVASWAEEPDAMLRELSTRASQPPFSATDKCADLALQANRLEEKVLAQLVEDPGQAAKFTNLLALAREIGPLTETHNYWIDRMAQARLRSMTMRVSTRLVREGVLAAPGDIFYLHRHEIAEAIVDSCPRHTLIASRQAEHEQRRRMRPPTQVGAPSMGDGLNDRFEGENVLSEMENILYGTGASPGFARGPARVTLSPDDFGHIKAGEIIVCPSMNVSWLPVFSVAAGIVTNAGGILSHAAVVAREFGLPAVVGARNATHTIETGKMLEIDGAKGIVRVV